MDIFNCCKFAGADLISYASIASILIAENLTSNEADLLGNFLMSIGQNLATIAVVKEKCETKLRNSIKDENK
ncbi:MAG: hypothetical protein PHP54_01680 [Clostridia bacterium]|nr:hypothetical protein [Clostridia bacterium]